MTDFWQLEHRVIVVAPDSAIPKLEQLAANRNCESDWEFYGSNSIQFRFADKLEAQLFAVWAGMLDYAEVIEAPLKAP